MGPQTLLDYLSTMSPVIWTCGGALVLIVVVIKVVILPIIED